MCIHGVHSEYVSSQVFFSSNFIARKFEFTKFLMIWLGANKLDLLVLIIDKLCVYSLMYFLLRLNVPKERFGAYFFGTNCMSMINDSHHSESYDIF